jgi:hypothetical protein
MKLFNTVLAALSFCAASSAFAYGGFASIAYSPSTGAYGSDHGAASVAAAEDAAQSYCGGNCSVFTYVENGWVALAVGNNGAYGTGGIHDSEYDAEQSALSNCGGDANGCYVLRSTSSFFNSPDVDGVNPQ